MATLTTTPTEVGSNLGVTVGARLLAWYSDADSSGATAHLKLQAISQGIQYTGTNKDYELNLDGTHTGTVSWTYTPLNANTWYDVAEITQRVGSGATVSASGKVWTYVYGDCWVNGVSLTMPTFTSPPTGLAVSVAEIHPESVLFNVSISSYGVPSNVNGRWIEAGLAGQNVWTTPSLRSAIAQNVTSAQILVDNNSTQTTTLTIVPNTQYYYGGYANNTQVGRGAIFGQLVTLAPATTVSLDSVTSRSATFNYSVPADGGFYDKTLEYSIDGGTTWVTIATITGGSATTGTFTVYGLDFNTTYTLKSRVTTTSGTTNNTDVTFTTTYRLYGSVGGQTTEIRKLYGSVGGQTKEITKLYASVGGVTKRIF